MSEVFHAEIARDVATRGGSAIVRVHVPARRWREPAEGCTFDCDPEELWQLVGELLRVCSGGLLQPELR